MEDGRPVSFLSASPYHMRCLSEQTLHPFATVLYLTSCSTIIVWLTEHTSYAQMFKFDQVCVYIYIIIYIYICVCVCVSL